MIQSCNNVTLHVSDKEVLDFLSCLCETKWKSDCKTRVLVALKDKAQALSGYPNQNFPDT